MISTQTRVSFFRYVLLVAAFFVFFSNKQVFADVLDPSQPVTTCGEIVFNGTYTLQNSVSTSSGACFTITAAGGAGSTIIDGQGLYTITGDVVGDGVNLGAPGYNFTIQNTTVVGKVSSNGSVDSSGSFYRSGRGGSIVISTSTVGVVQANGGNNAVFPAHNVEYSGSGGSVILNSSSVTQIDVNAGSAATSSSGNGGNGGSVVINGTSVNISGMTLSLLKGVGSSHTGTSGTLTINYTTLNTGSFNFPTLSNLTLNGPGNIPGSLGVFSGGILSTNVVFPGATITSASQCDLVFAGTYTLGSDITGDCRIAVDGVILDGGNNGSGGHYTVNGNINGNGNNSGDNGHAFTLQNINFNGVVSSRGNSTGSSGSITITNSNIDMSQISLDIAGGSLTLNYITLTTGNYVFQPLANLTLNGPGNVPGNLGYYGGGILSFPGDTITSADHCNLIIAGTSTLGSNITGDCHIYGTGVILDGAGHTINGNVFATSTTGNGHSVILENIIITGKVDTSAATGTGATAGNITMTSSSVANIISNGANGGTTGGNAGTINLTDTSFVSLVANGGVAYIGGFRIGYGGYGGNVNIIKTSGTLDLSSTTIDITHGSGPSGYGYHQTICPGVCSPFYPGSPLAITASHLTVNTATYLLGVITLTINSLNYGSWNGVFNNSSIFYFNDQITGAGYDGDWNNPLNWWADSLFTVPIGHIPSIISSIIASGTLNLNSGSAVTVDNATFNNASQNHVDMTALNGFTFNNTSINYANTIGSAVFNDSSIDYGTSTGKTVFVGNNSENYAAVRYQPFSASNASDAQLGIVPQQKIAKVTPGYYIYGPGYASWQKAQISISTDAGNTWTTVTAPYDWASAKYSYDGTKLVGTSGSVTYVSLDDGQSWTVADASHAWMSFSDDLSLVTTNASCDGTQCTVDISRDGGSTWNTSSFVSSINSQYYGAGPILSSADGQKLVLINSGSYYTQVYTSVDAGISWWNPGPGQSASFNEISGLMSSSGSRLIIHYPAYNPNTYVYDLYQWNRPIRQYTSSVNVGSRDFTTQKWVIQAVGAQVNLSSATYNTSSDVFQALSGGSFVSNSSINSGAAVVPQIVITSPTSGTVAKWSPSINWSTSVSCQYSYDNFVTTNFVVCSNNGSDIQKPGSNGANILYLQGMDNRGDITQKSISFTYDNTSPIPTSCGSDLLDESTRQYYYLAGDVTGDCIFKTNTELRGASSSLSTGYTINGNVIGTSTNSGFNVSLKNIKVTGMVTTTGANNTSGIGYKGGNINISTSTTGKIYANGGDGTTLGGNAGSIVISSSTGIQTTDTSVFARGGNATYCGYGGNGGNVSVLSGSVYGTITNGAGANQTLTVAQGGYCPASLPSGGSSYSSGGSVVISRIYNPTQPTPPTELVSVPASPAPTPSVSTSGGTSGSFISPIAPVTPVAPVTTPTPKPFFSGSFTEVAGAAAQKVGEAATAFVNSPASKTVQATGFFGGLVASVAFFTETSFATPIAASEMVLIPARLWGLVLMGLGIRRKSRPWGTVYDSVTKQPIDPAYITARDSTGRVVAEAVTDVDGRYGFLLPDGVYYISAKKTNYSFPSKKLDGRQADELYNDLYFGEPVTVKGGQVIDKNIPLDQVNFDWNEQNKTQVNSSNSPTFHTRHERPVAIISNYAYAVGLIISVVAVAIQHSAFNILILISYALILIFLKWSAKPKRLGNVFDKQHKPLSYAIIRVTTPDKMVTLRSCVSDAEGRYYCIVPKGEYVIEIQKKNPDGSYTQVYESAVKVGTSGIVSESFVV